jgi:hypothetical protein
LIVKAVPALAEAGDEAVDADTLMSVDALTAVVELALVMLLLPVFESSMCCWSIEADAADEKLWFEAPVHVTDQDAFTGVAVDCARDVFCTVTGLVLLVVQSPGSVRVNVVSTLTGVTGPLL